jgi:hypothetical protein
VITSPRSRRANIYIALSFHFLQFVLPLAHLLMRRAIQIFRSAKLTAIHDDELDVIANSIYVVRSAVRDRLQVLKCEWLIHGLKHILTCAAVHKMHDLNQRAQLRKFSFGMVRFLSPCSPCDHHTHVHPPV